MPWITARSALAELSVTPISNDVLGTAAWLFVAWVTGGTVVFLLTESPAVIGGAGALSLNVSVLIWMVGAKASWAFPVELVPDNAAIRLGAGPTVGLLGGTLVVAGSAYSLAEQTWTMPAVHFPRWVWPSAVALLLAGLLVREFDWVIVEANSIDWPVDFGAIPVLGDGVAAALLTSIALIVTYVLRPRRWVAVSLICVSMMAAIIATVALLSGALLERAVGELLDQVGDIGLDNPSITATQGPTAVLVFSAGLLLFGVLSLRQYRDRSVSPVENSTPHGGAASTEMDNTSNDLPF